MAEAVVLLPGMMCDARLYAPQLAALSRDHAVTVAPITRGERVEEIASGLLDVLPGRFALAGLSMGGIVAMELLRRAPDRITRLALMDTNALPETPQSAAQYEPLIIAARAGRVDEAVAQMVHPEVLAPGPGRMRVLDVVRQMASDMGAEVFVRQARALQRRRDYQAELRRCKVPTLVLCGAHDALTPVKRHRFMAELIGHAQLCVLEDAGHLPTLEAPDAVTGALRDWLAQPGPGEGRA